MRRESSSPFPDDPYVQLEAHNNNIPIHKVEDLAAYIDYPLEKLMLVGKPDIAQKAIPILREALQDTFSVFGSEPYFIEVVPPGVNKATSLQALLDYLGVDREEMIACGDAMNDYEMLAMAGLSVAMENAVPAIRQAADFVTYSNDADGIAHVIDTFLP